jgi:hypothetical protein
MMSKEKKSSGWLQRGKDSTTAFVLERTLGKALARYGRVLSLQLDSRQKAAQIEVLLKGEDEPLTVRIEEYELVQEEAMTYIDIKKASASREWVNALLEDRVQGKRFPIPEKFAAIVRLVG